VKALHIIARLNIGGAANTTILLVDNLRHVDVETRLVTGQVGENEGDMAYFADAYGVEPEYLPTLGREISPLNDLRTIWQLYRIMRRWKPDVVHTHTAKAGLVGRLAAWLARVPVRVHTFHGHVFKGYFSPRKTQFYLTLERLMARLSTAIVTVSDAQKDELSRVYKVAPAEKFSVQEYGFDLQPLTVRPSQADIDAFITAHKLPPGPKLVGIIGRLVPIKNHDLFLQAATQVAAQRDDVHFVIAGDGERRDELRAQVAMLKMQERVTFTGWITDIKPVMAALDMMVLTSNNEGTPVSIIEAMAAGLPVISTDVGGVRDILRDGELGQVIPSGDVDALAAAMLKALDGSHPDPAAARAMALTRFDLKARAQAMRALYDRLRK
jgi:glycosyltransferase involved in cell wall biosynthesis